MKKLSIVAALLLACPSDASAQQASPSPFGGTTDRSIDTTKSLSAMEAPRIPDLPAPNLGWTDNPAVHQPARKFTFGVQYKYMAPELMLVGGHTLLDSVFSKFTALPYGAGDNGGCVFSVLMSFAPLTGTNCGAGAYEAVADYTLAINNPPGTSPAPISGTRTASLMRFRSHPARRSSDPPFPQAIAPSCMVALM